MPILAIFSGPTITKEQYETIRREVGWEVSNPPGGVFHVAGFDERGGLHVADVWESADALNHFVGTLLMPVMQKHNIAAPTVEVVPVHNANAYPAVQAFLMKSKAAPKSKPKPKAKVKAKKRR